MAKFNVVATQDAIDSYITKFTQDELNDEEWRKISDITKECLLKIGNERENILQYVHNYYVSNLGRIARIDDNNNLILKSGISDKGEYLHVDLYYNLNNKKGIIRMFIHQIVGFLFNPEKYSHEKDQINHLDEVHYNNRSNNLSWSDGYENTNYGTGIERAAKGRKTANQQRKNKEKLLSDEEKNELKNKRRNQTLKAVEASVKLRKRPIKRINIDTNEVIIFDQMSQAIQNSDCSERAIRNGIKKNIIVKGKYKFSYADGGQANNKFNRKIVKLDIYSSKFIKLYNNITEIKNENIDISRISKCCNGKIKFTEGYKWMFLEDYLKMMNISDIKDLPDSEYFK